MWRARPLHGGLIAIDVGLIGVNREMCEEGGDAVLETPGGHRGW